jgi:hypothetical protein
MRADATSRVLTADKPTAGRGSQNGLAARRPGRTPAPGKENDMRSTAALLLAGFAAVAVAAPNWQPVGENANGNKVFVDKASVKSAGGITTVVYRTEMKSALDTFGGGITSMRSTMKVNCKEGTAAGVEVVLFEDEAKNKVFSRNKAAKTEYLKEPAGGAADLVIKAVCPK